MSSTTRSVGLAAFSETVNTAAPELRLLMRFMGVLVFVTGALAAYLWTRMEVRETSRALDDSRALLVTQETLRDRLRVERTMLLAPGRLGAVAVAEDLVAPAAVVDVVLPLAPRPGQP